jgi:hypothetical protein
MLVWLHPKPNIHVLIEKWIHYDLLWAPRTTNDINIMIIKGNKEYHPSVGPLQERLLSLTLLNKVGSY